MQEKEPNVLLHFASVTQGLVTHSSVSLQPEPSLRPSPVVPSGHLQLPDSHFAEEVQASSHGGAESSLLAVSFSAPLSVLPSVVSSDSEGVAHAAITALAETAPPRRRGNERTNEERGKRFIGATLCFQGANVQRLGLKNGRMFIPQRWKLAQLEVSSAVGLPRHPPAKRASHEAQGARVQRTVVGWQGIEPWTYRLKVCSSTD